MINKAEIFRLAREHLNAGRIPQAKAVFNRALAKAPHDPDLCRNFGLTLVSLGEPEAALHYLERASKHFPSDADLACAIATMYSDLGRDEKALAIYERVLTTHPNHAGALGCVGNTHFLHRRYDEALPRLRQAVEHSPDDPSLRQYLALCLVEMARAREGYDVLCEGLARVPGDRTMVECRAVVSNYLDDLTPETILAHHREFAESIEPHANAANPIALADPNPDRRLRVGLVSPDLHEHPVACFAEAIFEQLDRAHFEVIAYALRAREDSVTQRLRSKADAWRTAVGPGWDDAGFVANVRKDKIDILVDLAGLTQDHRLNVFARRAAPVQATAIGYPTTTGLASMDYRIVDAITDPSPRADACARERLARLDRCFLCYRPPPTGSGPGSEWHPAPSATPSDPATSPITFGCFSTMRKASPATFATWAEALRAVPGSRLLLKAPALATPSVREDLTRRFATAGIDTSRLDLLPWAPGHADHLAVYQRVDLALDTFPYTGTTTTCEALWMGVPVITREGAHHASRVSASLLHAVGHREWIADDAAGVARIASDLARDPAALRARRPALRQQLLGSALCDAKAYAASLGTAYRAMWRERVRGI